MNLDLAVARIRNHIVHNFPPAERAEEAGKNVAKQQKQLEKFTHGRAPAGWSAWEHVDFIGRLIDLQTQFRECELEAA